MIKGRFVALVEADFDYGGEVSDERFEALHSFVFNGGFSDLIKEYLLSEMTVSNSHANVEVTQQYGDVVRLEDSDESD